MAHTPMQDLKDFHDRFIQDRDLGVLKDGKILPCIEKRRKLIMEESREVEEALEDYKAWAYYSGKGLTKGGDVQEIREHLAKELADLLYVVYGTADELHIPLEEVFAKVHQSNMDKLWPDGKVHYNEYGKVIKPPTYSPPDLSFIHGDRVS